MSAPPMPEGKTKYATRLDEQADRDLARLGQVLDGQRDAEVARLAALDPLAYDREREVAAEKLSVRVSTLDKAVKAERGKAGAGSGHEVTFNEPVPWPDTVEPRALLDELAETIKHYVRMR